MATPSPSGLFNEIVTSATHPTENLIHVYKTVLVAQSYHICNTAEITDVVGGRGGALIESGGPALRQKLRSHRLPHRNGYRLEMNIDRPKV